MIHCVKGSKKIYKIQVTIKNTFVIYNEHLLLTSKEVSIWINVFLKVARSIDWWTSDGKLFQMRITCIAWLKECRSHDVQWCSDIWLLHLEARASQIILVAFTYHKKACRYSGASIFRHLKNKTYERKFLRYSKNWIPAACIIRARFGQIK